MIFAKSKKLLLFFLILFQSIIFAVDKKHAAGIIPYCIDNSGKVKILLSKGITRYPSVLDSTLGKFISSYKEKWCDLGGGYKEGENPKIAAAREAHEETMGIFSSNKNVFKIDPSSEEELEKGTNYWYKKLYNKYKVETGFYTYWFVKVPYISSFKIKRLFNILSEKKSITYKIQNYIPIVSRLKDPYLEKNDYRWVDAKNLMNLIKNKKSYAKPYDLVEIRDPINFKNKLDLYYRFFNSLKDGAKILQKIIDEKAPIFAKNIS